MDLLRIDYILYLGKEKTMWWDGEFTTGNSFMIPCHWWFMNSHRGIPLRRVHSDRGHEHPLRLLHVTGGTSGPTPLLLPTTPRLRSLTDVRPYSSERTYGPLLYRGIVTLDSRIRSRHGVVGSSLFRRIVLCHFGGDSTDTHSTDSASPFHR